IQDDEHIDDAEYGGDDDEEVTRQHAPRMIPHERAPRLRAAPRAWRRSRRHVAPDGARRHADPKLHKKLRGDPFLAPRSIGSGHVGDQLAHVWGNAGTSWRVRFPSPK